MFGGYLVFQVAQGGGIARCTGFGQCFAPFHLLHQEFGVEGGVFGGVGIYVLRHEQVGGAIDGVFQDAVGFVYGGSHHHGLFLFESRCRGKFVGMAAGSQRAVAGFKRVFVDLEGFGQAEQGKVLVHRNFLNA